MPAGRYVDLEKKRRTEHLYYLSHREHILGQASAWAKANPERMNKRNRRWKKAHRAICNAQDRRRRAARAGAPVNDLTHDQWLEIQAAQNYRCYYCGKQRKGKLTQDHIQPLSEGGSHTLHNVIGACRSCNSSKGTKKPPIPVQPLLLTVAPAKKRKAS